MNSLVLGHTGFIGKNIGGRYHLENIDLKSISDVLRGFDEAQFLPKPEVLINCAGKHGSMLEMRKNHFDYVNTNFAIDSNCLSLCVQRGIDTAIMISSTTCFPDNPLVDVFSEQDIYNGGISKSVYGYALSKRNTIDLCKCAYLDFGLNTIPVVLGNCYGKHGVFSNTGTIIHKLIYDISTAMNNNTDVFLTGDGLDIRTFLFAEDLPNIFERLSSLRLKGEPVIVASSEQITIRELSNMIANIMGFKKNIVFDGKQTAGHRKKVAVSNIIDIDSFNLTSLESGLRKTIDFYRKNTDRTNV